MNIPMYKALLSAGADEKLATEAVQTLPSDPATKADIADLRVWLMWRLMLAMGAQLGLFVAIIKLWN